MTMDATHQEITSAVGAVINESRQLCGITIKTFCHEAGISLHSYYRLMHKKRPHR